MQRPQFVAGEPPFPGAVFSRLSASAQWTLPLSWLSSLPLGLASRSSEFKYNDWPVSTTSACVWQRAKNVRAPLALGGSSAGAGVQHSALGACQVIDSDQLHSTKIWVDCLFAMQQFIAHSLCMASYRTHANPPEASGRRMRFPVRRCSSLPARGQGKQIPWLTASPI